MAEKKAKGSPAIKLGILGCASIARKVSRAALLAGPSSVELYAVASRSLEKAREFARANKFPESAKAYGSYEELLDDAAVDAVYVPLPTGLHLEWVSKAAEKGKHVLLEKPLSMRVEELDAMLEACEKNGLQLMDGTMWMHHPRTARMHQDLKEKLGQIKEIRSVFSFPAEILFPTFLKENIRVKSGLDGLGALGDLGWYCIRGFLWATDFELPSEVTALPGLKLNDAGIITSCAARLVWPDGRAATFSCSFHAFMTMQLEVHGDRGALLCPDFVVPFNDRRASYKLLSNCGFADMDLAWGFECQEVEVDNSLPQEASMVAEFARLVGEIKFNGGKPEYKWHQFAKATQAVVCAVADSIAAGCTTITIKN